MTDWSEIAEGRLASVRLPRPDPNWDQEDSDEAEPVLRRAMRALAEEFGVPYIDECNPDNPDQFCVEWGGSWSYSEYGGALRLKLPLDKLAAVLEVLLIGLR